MKKAMAKGHPPILASGTPQAGRKVTALVSVETVDQRFNWGENRPRLRLELPRLSQLARHQRPATEAGLLRRLGGGIAGLLDGVRSLIGTLGSVLARLLAGEPHRFELLLRFLGRNAVQLVAKDDEVGLEVAGGRKRNPSVALVGTSEAAGPRS